jgi:DNA-binding NarL/FixJ family response regulator
VSNTMSTRPQRCRFGRDRHVVQCGLHHRRCYGGKPVQRGWPSDARLWGTGRSGVRSDEGKGIALTGRDDVTATLDAARAAYEKRQWAQARTGFLAARAAGPLSAEDMAALADTAWWEGAIDQSLSAGEEAYRLFLQDDDPRARSAAMLAIDIGFSWFLRGEEALGSGWISRAQRLLDGEEDCAEHGYVQSLAIDEALAMADFDGAIEAARTVAGIGTRHGDETLCAYALVGEGVALIKQGRVRQGLAALDEAMLPVVAGRVRPTWAGNIYCQLMSVCHELADLRRAGQWTDATARWCEGFSDAVMFLGVCRVHRAQLLQVHGQWALAEEEIAEVCRDLASMNVGAVGLALYELGEIRRMRGDLGGAAAAYAEAHEHGKDPHPGLALVWVAEGNPSVAVNALAACETTSKDPLVKTRLWEALVEAAVAAGNLATARVAADALDEAAATYASPGLVAAAAQSRGLFCLAAGDTAVAIDALRAARRNWRELDAPYRVARARLELAEALERSGDERGASLERDAAAAALARLGATAPMPTQGRPALPDGITRREAEVLALVAQGLTNREVADRLVLSERTVARHLANLYTRIGVTSRTAATTYAHRHGLVGPSSA